MVHAINICMNCSYLLQAHAPREAVSRDHSKTRVRYEGRPVRAGCKCRSIPLHPFSYTIVLLNKACVIFVAK